MVEQEDVIKCLSELFGQFVGHILVAPVRCISLHVRSHMDDPTRSVDRDYKTQHRETDPPETPPLAKLKNQVHIM